MRQDEADQMLKFTMQVCRLQDESGRYYCFEHPAKASSWKMVCVAWLDLRSRPN